MSGATSKEKLQQWQDLYPSNCGGWPELFRRLDAIARQLNRIAASPVRRHPKPERIPDPRGGAL
jgi:hypothetical protein